MAIEIGQPAPEFTLFDTDKKEVSLSNFNGKNVLLLFFPLAFTSVCTEELCSVRDNLKMYEDLNATSLGISVDSLFTLRAFKKEQNLNFPLLSDFNKSVSEAYGALYKQWNYGMLGVTKRATFLIDANGLVRYAEVLENASDLPKFPVIKETLARL